MEPLIDLGLLRGARIAIAARFLFALTAAVACACSHSGTGAVTPAKVPSPQPDANSRYSALVQLLADAAVSPFSRNPTIRQYTFMALYLFAIKPNRTDSDVATAKGYISTAFQSQCFDRAACGRDFGLIRFHRGDAQYDYNSTAFTLQGLAPVLAAHRDRFTGPELDALRPHIDAALGALDTRGPRPDYTNIFLMRATDLVLIGEALADLDARYQRFADRGYQLFDDWKKTTSAVGIREFDSPSYYAADLDSLVIGYLHAKQKARFAAMLDYFWTDLGATFFPARGSMSGPHSRDYQFLTGYGAVDWYLYLSGWRNQVPADTSSSDPPLERVFVAYNSSAKGGYVPPPSACALAFTTPKLLTSLWGDAASGYDRTNYVGRGFALGGTSHDYGLGPQEKIVTLELANAQTVISLVTEDDQTSDNPYGAKTQQGNFSKPFRLPSFPVVAQKDGLLLVTSYAAPLASHATTLLATNILLPTDAAVSKGGTVIATATDLAVGDVVEVRARDSVGALRFFRADGCSGKPATLRVLFEKSSATSGVDRARIVVYHANGVSAAGCAARVSFVLAGEDCASNCSLPAMLRAATLTESTAGTWKTNVKIGQVTLGVERNDDFGRNLHTIASRTATGSAFSTTLLRVNGQNVAPPL